jgi:hypothetical protein
VKVLVLNVPLSACGSGTSVPPDQQYDDRFDRYYELDAVNVSSNFTAESAMPAAGSATYRGVGYVYYTVGGLETNLLGDATIRANFNSDSMSGSLNNFVGGQVIGGSVDNIATYTGQLNMDGEIGTATAGCNACFAGQLMGSLTGQGDSIQVDAALLGHFFGSNGTSITGFTPNTETVLVNGGVTPGGAVFLGER